MAGVLYGGGVVGISGSIGGSTFARNRSGPYIRPRTKPINPNSEKQVKIRSIIAYLCEVWSDILTGDQRDAWGVYASNVAMKGKFGQTIHLSGFNHYIRSNAIRLYYFRFVVNVAPTDFTLPDKDPTVWIDVDESPQLITVHYNNALGWCNEDGGKMFIQQGIPQNGTRNFFAGPWHILYSLDGTAGGGEPEPKPLAPHYAVALGQKCWCRFRISRADGRLSEPFYAQAIVHGQAPGEVPMLIGQTQEQAVILLTRTQLVLGDVTTENSETVPVDIIISQDPVVHTKLEIGASASIVVSLGPPA